MKRAFGPGVALLLLASCNPMNNTHSNLALDCGPGVDAGRSYLHVFDPQGRPLLGEAIQAKILKADGSLESEWISRDGCVENRDRGDSSLLISPKQEGLNWGLVVTDENRAGLDAFRLQNLPSLTIDEASCQNLPSRGEITLPLQWPRPLNRSLAIHARIARDGLNLVTSDLSPDKQSVDVSTTVEDGHLAVTYSYRNLFKNAQDSGYQTNFTCQYRLDRQAPMIATSLKRELAPQLFRVDPDEKIALLIQDAAPKLIYSCLSKLGEDGCQRAQDFTVHAAPETTYTAPASGKWLLKYFGEDEAGNRSEVQTVAFIAFQNGAIDEITAILGRAQLLFAQDTIAAWVQMAHAFRKYLALPTSEEQAAIHRLLFETFVHRQTAALEKNRWHAVYPEKFAVVAGISSADRFLTLGVQGLKLWDKSGVTIGEYKAFGSSLFVKGDIIAVVGGGPIQLLRLKDKTFESLGSVAVPNFTELQDFIWNPAADEFLVTYAINSIGGRRVFRHVLARWDENAYKTQAALTTNSILGAVWSADGQYLALNMMDNRLSGMVQVFEKDTNNVWMPRAADLFPGKSAGMVFLKSPAGHTTLAFTRDNKLLQWTPKYGLEEPMLASYNAGLAHEAPVFLQVGPSQALMLGKTIELVTFTEDDYITNNQISKIAGNGIVKKWQFQDNILTLQITETDLLLGEKTYVMKMKLVDGALRKEQTISGGDEGIDDFANTQGNSETITLSERTIRVWNLAASPYIVSIPESSNNSSGWMPTSWAGSAPPLYVLNFRPFQLSTWSSWNQKPITRTLDQAETVRSLAWGEQVFAGLAEGGRIGIWDRDFQKVGETLAHTPSQDSLVKSMTAKAAFFPGDTTLVSFYNADFRLWKRTAAGYVYQRSFFEDFKLVIDAPGSQQRGQNGFHLVTWGGKTWILAWRTSIVEGDIPETQIGLFDENGEPAPMKRLKLQKDPKIIIDPAGVRVLSHDYDFMPKTLHVHNLTSEGFVEQTLDFGKGYFALPMFHPKNNSLTVLLGTNEYQVWDFKDGALVPRTPVKLTDLNKDPMNNFAWWPDQEHFFYFRGKSMYVIDQEGRSFRNFSLNPNASVSDIQISQDGRYLLFRSSGEGFRIMDTREPPAESLNWICGTLGDFLKNSNEADYSSNLSADDLKVCK